MGAGGVNHIPELSGGQTPLSKAAPACVGQTGAACFSPPEVSRAASKFAPLSPAQNGESLNNNGLRIRHFGGLSDSAPNARKISAAYERGPFVPGIDWIRDHVEYDTNGGCWLWPRATQTGGYGSAGPTGAKKVLHRLAWETVNGPIADGLVVCHRCDVRECCNPDHMFLGTIKENAEDRSRKGRSHKGGPAANLNAETVAFARAMYRAGAVIEDIAEGIRTAKTSVRLAIAGVTWGHVPEPCKIRRRAGNPSMRFAVLRAAEKVMPKKPAYPPAWERTR